MRDDSEKTLAPDTWPYTPVLYARAARAELLKLGEALGREGESSDRLLSSYHEFRLAVMEYLRAEDSIDAGETDARETEVTP